MSSQPAARRRFRFTLRGLLAAVTVFCMVLGLVTGVYRWQAVRWQEEQATLDIAPYGGVYSMASAVYCLRSGGKSKGWFFVTFLNYVEAVDLSPHNWAAVERRGKTLAVTDDALSMLRRFRHLRSLNLRDTPITDAGLRHIHSLKELEELDLRGTQVTDEGVEKLQKALPECRIAR